MSDTQGGPTPGRALAGTLLLLFGLCIFLVGGACTIIWLGELADSYTSGRSEALLLLLLSAAVAALGLFAIVKGGRLLRGPPPPRQPDGDAA